MTEPAPWSNSFSVEGSQHNWIELAQSHVKDFQLRSTITYTGAMTGLEDKVKPATLKTIRTVSPQTLPSTDLASVPAPLQWLVNRYGIHTPAALIHDALIGTEKRPDDMTDAYADLYFRYMLADLGVPLIRRWLMWAATALRTRFVRGGLARWSLVAWVIASACGIIIFASALWPPDWTVLILSGLAPAVFAIFWGRQYEAGLIAAYTAPWVLPPTLFGWAGSLVYRAVETVVGWFWKR